MDNLPPSHRDHGGEDAIPPPPSSEENVFASWRINNRDTVMRPTNLSDAVIELHSVDDLEAEYRLQMWYSGESRQKVRQALERPEFPQVGTKTSPMYAKGRLEHKGMYRARHVPDGWFPLISEYRISRNTRNESVRRGQENPTTERDGIALGSVDLLAAGLANSPEADGTEVDGSMVRVLEDDDTLYEMSDNEWVQREMDNDAYWLAMDANGLGRNENYWKKHAEDYADTPDDDDYYVGDNISDL